LLYYLDRVEAENYVPLLWLFDIGLSLRRPGSRLDNSKWDLRCTMWPRDRFSPRTSLFPYQHRFINIPYLLYLQNSNQKNKKLMKPGDLPTKAILLICNVISFDKYSIFL